MLPYDTDACMMDAMITLTLTRDEAEWLQLTLETAAESAHAYGEGEVEQMAERLAMEIEDQLD